MFGFTPISRTSEFKYKRNLIQSAIFQLCYPTTEAPVCRQDDIARLLSDHFPKRLQIAQGQISFPADSGRTPTTPLTSSVIGLEFHSTDESRVLSITKDAVVYTVPGLAYTNHHEIVSEIEQLIPQLFSICEITGISRVSTRKINLIQYISKTEINPLDTIQKVFNKSLAQNLSSLPASNFLAHSVANLSFVDGLNQLNLVYGLLPPVVGPNTRKVVLDIDMLVATDVLPLSKIADTFRLINSEIFNIFRWSLNDTFVTKLDEEKPA